MLGPRIKTVFRSRWNALFWSANILLTAYCSVPPSDETDAAHPPPTVAQKPAKHVNPWAKAAGGPAK